MLSHLNVTPGHPKSRPLRPLCVTMYPCLQMLAGVPQSRQGLQSPAEGGQAGVTPQLESQDRLVFAQPLEELDPSDTEQEKV